MIQISKRGDTIVLTSRLTEASSRWPGAYWASPYDKSSPSPPFQGLASFLTHYGTPILLGVWEYTRHLERGDRELRRMRGDQSKSVTPLHLQYNH